MISFFSVLSDAEEDNNCVIEEERHINPITSMELLDMIDGLSLEPEIEELLYDKFTTPEV